MKRIQNSQKKHKHNWLYFMMFPVGFFYCGSCDATKPATKDLNTNKKRLGKHKMNCGVCGSMSCTKCDSYTFGVHVSGDFIRFVCPNCETQAANLDWYQNLINIYLNLKKDKPGLADYCDEKIRRVKEEKAIRIKHEKAIIKRQKENGWIFPEPRNE